jgi:hypothetical protein
MGYKSNNHILLYRGFNYLRYKPLIDDIQNVQIGDIYITPTFLSTTVLEKIAVTFVSSDKEIENNILWCIRVNGEFFKQLQYSYLGDDIMNIFNLEMIIDTNNYESEILLNFGAQLKLTNIHKINNVTYTYKNIQIINKSYTLYEFDFVGYNYHQSESILNKVTDLKTCLEKSEFSVTSKTTTSKKRPKSFSPSSSSAKKPTYLF